MEPALYISLARLTSHAAAQYDPGSEGASLAEVKMGSR
jgi:hypothetical protein